MKISKIAIIAFFVTGVLLSDAAAAVKTKIDMRRKGTSGLSDEITGRIAHEIGLLEGYKKDLGRKTELYDKYLAKVGTLDKQEEKLKTLQSALADSQKKKEDRINQINELTGKIDTAQRQAGVLDSAAQTKIDFYKLQKQNMEKEADDIIANIPYLTKGVTEATANRDEAAKELGEVQKQINTEHKSVANLEQDIGGWQQIISNVESMIERAKEEMSEEELKMLQDKITKADLAKSQAGETPKPAAKPKYVAPLSPKEKPAQTIAPGEEAQLPDQGDQDKEIARAKELGKTLKPATPDTPPLTAGGEQIIGISCGTELMQSPDGKTVYTRLRSTELSSVTILKDGKTYDISGVEATKILVRKGYFVHMTNVGLVATNRYMSATSDKPSKTGGSWRDDLQTQPMSPDDAAVYAGGTLGADTASSDDTPAWRKRGRSYKMSPQDEAVYAGALLGGGAASREHDTAMSQKDADTYGAGVAK